MPLTKKLDKPIAEIASLHQHEECKDDYCAGYRNEMCERGANYSERIEYARLLLYNFDHYGTPRFWRVAKSPAGGGCR